MKVFDLIAGVDSEVMRECPGVDRLWSFQLGLSLVIAFCFVSSISYYSLGYFLHSEAARILIALLIASVVAMFDRALFQSDWFYMGVIQQIREALKNERRIDEKLRILIRYILRIFLRLGISLLIAYTLSLFVEVAIFDSAISEKVDAKFKLENAGFFGALQTLTSDFENAVASRQARIDQLNAQISDPKRRLQQAMSDGDKRSYDRDWSLLKVRQDDVEAGEAKIKKNNEDIRVWRNDVEAEINGTRIRPQNTGVPKCGPVCRTTQGLIRNAEKENNDLLARGTALQREIRDIENRLKGISDKYERADAALVERNNDEQKKLLHEVEDLRATRIARLSEKEAELKRSGVFKDRRDDPIVRVGFLKELKTDKDRGDVVSEISVMIKLFIMFLEIAPVLGKMFFSPPSAYAWRIRLQVGEQQLDTMLQLDRKIDEYQRQHLSNVEAADELMQQRKARMDREAVWDEAHRRALSAVKDEKGPHSLAGS